MRIQGSVALVTGSADRIGRAIALALAEKGAHVVIHYRRSAQAAKETVRACQRCGVRAIAIRADLTRAREVGRLFREIRSRFKRLDILINNAALFSKTPFFRCRESDWDLTLDTNLKGSFLCAQSAARLMVKKGCGKIINIADWSGIRPYTNYLPYCVSKAGVIALTKALALELAPKIQVACIAPGPVLLPKHFTKEEAKSIKGKLPLKRIGSPQDIAQTVLFLLEGTDFITGSTIVVDGGELIA
ncbi:MAG: SDR family oxidoreductase [Candidatus Omnitrophota bacterium]